MLRSAMNHPVHDPHEIAPQTEDSPSRAAFELNILMCTSYLLDSCSLHTKLLKPRKTMCFMVFHIYLCLDQVLTFMTFLLHSALHLRLLGSKTRWGPQVEGFAPSMDHPTCSGWVWRNTNLNHPNLHIQNLLGDFWWKNGQKLQMKLYSWSCLAVSIWSKKNNGAWQKQPLRVCAPRAKWQVARRKLLCHRVARRRKQHWATLALPKTWVKKVKPTQPGDSGTLSWLETVDLTILILNLPRSDV